MKTTTSNHLCLTFKEWALQVNTQYPDILEHMKKSMDPLDRTIARRIMVTVGMETVREIKN